MKRSEAIDKIRHFNRTYMPAMHLLDKNYLGMGYSLTDARTLFEIRDRSCPSSRELVQALGIDKGYLSRILKRFEREGIISRDSSTSDARMHTLCLTEKGQQFIKRFEEGGAALVSSSIDGATDEQVETLAQHMLAIEGILGSISGASKDMRVVEYDPSRKQDFIDLNTWWIERYFGTLEQADWDEFDNVDAEVASGAMVYFALTEDGTALATCMAIPRGKDEWEIAKLGSNPNREHKGAGTAVFEASVAWAEEHGAKRIYILTNSRLKPAIHIYESHGFERFDLKEFGYDRGDYALEKFL